MGARVIFVPNDDYCDQGGGGAERSGVGCNCLVFDDSCGRGEASQQAHSEDDVVAGAQSELFPQVPVWSRTSDAH